MTIDDQQGIRRARAALSRVIEPRDTIGHVLIEALGPVTSWEIVSSGRNLTAQEGLALTQAVHRAPDEVVGTMGSAAERWQARAAVVDLDADRRAQIRALVFDRARAAGLPVLMVTHDPQDAGAAGGPVLRLG